MKRRHVLASTIAAAALAGRARAQQRVRTIGFLASFVRPRDSALAAHPMLRTLAKHGYVVGRNLAVEWRFAAMQYDALPALAAELVRSPAEVIVTQGWPAAAAASAATTERPIVVYGSGDPVAIGLVASLARPGGNVTGVSEYAAELSGKRLELLSRIVPRASRIAVLWNANDQGMSLRYRALNDAAPKLGIAIDAYALRSIADVDAALAASRPDAVLVVVDSFTQANRRRILDAATARAAGDVRVRRRRARGRADLLRAERRRRRRPRRLLRRSDSRRRQARRPADGAADAVLPHPQRQDRARSGSSCRPTCLPAPTR